MPVIDAIEATVEQLVGQADASEAPVGQPVHQASDGVASSPMFTIPVFVIDMREEPILDLNSLD